MKFLAILILVTASVSSFASESVILTKTYSKRDSWELFRYQYRLNTNLGRAWFKVEIENEGGPHDDLEWEDHRVMPEGMVYDQATGEVRINDTICATTRQGRRSIKIYPTGRCVLTDRNTTIQVDDGFNINTKKQLQIILELR